jgi:hypothetical protein
MVSVQTQFPIVISDYFIFFSSSSSFSILYATSASKENGVCCGVAAEGGAGRVTPEPREANFKER